MYESDIGRTASENLELLASVAKHKAIFFRAAAARYEEARRGSLRLVPPPERIAELENDYGKMREMMFDEPPAFSQLLDVLANIESQVNRK